MNKTRRVIATALIAGAVSVGAGTVATVGAGTASACPRFVEVCNQHPTINIKGSGTYKPFYTKWFGLHDRKY